MADVLAVWDAYQAQQWAMVVQERAASGLSNREFRRLRGFSEKEYLNVVSESVGRRLLRMLYRNLCN